MPQIVWTAIICEEDYSVLVKPFHQHHSYWWNSISENTTETMSENAKTKNHCVQNFRRVCQLKLWKNTVYIYIYIYSNMWKKINFFHFFFLFKYNFLKSFADSMLYLYICHKLCGYNMVLRLWETTDIKVITK
jgi:hypothetical protein